MRLLPYLLGTTFLSAVSLAQTGGAWAVEPISVLLDQAQFWHGKGRDDLAQQSLKRVLVSDPDQQDALYYLAIYAAKEGKDAEARSWAQRFSAAAPDDPRNGDIARAMSFGTSGKKLVEAARKLVAEQDFVAAVNTYRSAFGNGAPPSEYAPEFYQTLAGTEGGWEAARAGLAKLASERPNDTKIQIAYGRVLSYRDTTRRSAVAALSKLDGNADAASAQRQALLWLDAKPADAELYRTYLVAHPDDSAVAQRLNAALNPVPSDPGAIVRQEGFENLKAGNTPAAESRFSEALKKNPEDSDALGGAGVTALRAGRYDEAEQKLARAVDLDPGKRDQWDQALSSARFYGALEKAEDARRSGDLPRAEKIAEDLSNSGYRDSRQAQLLYADVLARQNKLGEAESAYRRVLKTSSSDPNAVTGLARVLNKQGKSFEADALLANLSPDTLAANPGTRKAAAEVSAARAKSLAQSGDALGASQAFETALATDPQDPWIRLDYARHLETRGDAAQADSVMAAVGANAKASPESLYAAALFEQERGRNEQALALLQRIPANRLTSDMKALSSTAKSGDVIVEAKRAAARGDMFVAVRSLQELAADPRSSVQTRSKAAQALFEIGQTRAAVALARQEVTRGVAGAPGDYAGFLDVLARAGADADARALLARVETLAARQGDTTQLAEMKTGLTIAQADRLRLRRDYAGAYDVLAGALQSAPEDTKLLSATARLYQSGGMMPEAQRVYDHLLESHPGDGDLIAEAADGALAAKDLKRSARLIEEGMQVNPRASRLYLLQGRLAQARGDQRGAKRAFQIAQQLRAEELGALEPMAESGARPVPMLASTNPFRARGETRVSAAEPPLIGLGAADAGFVYAPGASPESAPVIGARYAPGFAEDVPRPAGTQVASANIFGDPLTREIDQTLDRLDDDLSPRFAGGVDVRSRSGEEGLSKLTDISGNISYGFSPSGTGRLTATATPVVINAGTPTGSALRRFGTNPLLTAPPPVSGQQSSGVALNLAYTFGTVRLDAGVTPLGFSKIQPVGGVEWRPRLGESTELQISGERRAVTDSVLSYAGAQDVLSGREWGAVVKTGGRVGVSYDDGDTGLYASGAYRYYDGEDVQTNTGLELNAGGYIRPYRSEDSEFRVGFNTNFLRFKRNLRYFTFGQGGYFSPQQFVSVSLPLSYEAHDGRWGYKLEAAPGLQYFHENASPYFPTDPALQGRLAALALVDPTVSAFYPGQTKTGFGIRGGAEFTYALTDRTSLAAALKFDNFGDYNETTAAVSLKHTLGR